MSRGREIRVSVTLLMFVFDPLPFRHDFASGLSGSFVVFFQGPVPKRLLMDGEECAHENVYRGLSTVNLVFLRRRVGACRILDA